MLKIKTFLITLFIVNTTFAQEKPFYEDYSWDKNPNYNIEKGTDASIISLKHKILSEFYFEGDGLVEYFLEHKVLWLNSDEEIESYNKVYLPYTSSSELKINKARVITKEGKTLVLDESKILTAQDEETGQNYKFFAFEGINKGSFIEYYYVVKRYPRYSGNRITFQTDHKKNNVEFDLYAPKNLVFKFKTYNNTPEVELNKETEDKLHWQLKMDSIDALQNEELSAYHASKKYVVYKLDRNTASSAKDISSYSKVSQNVYSNYYTELNKKTQSLLKKFVKEITKGKKLDEETLIRKLEYYIKNNVLITDDGSDNLSDLNAILNKKVANERGILKLYIALFKSLDIKHEIVITSNRKKIKFDEKFEANNFLTDFLIYFNKNKTYLSPTELESRYAYPPAYLTDNYGLFIKEIKVGDFLSGLGKVKYIKPIEAEKTVDKMILNIDFEKDNLSNCNVKLNRSMGGYYGMYIQPVIHLIKEKDELVESFAKQINEDINITKKEIVNDDPELFGIKPIAFVVDFNSEAFVEKAGKKYLFKVGELIGRQMELYQEKKRSLPLENEFTRSYYRTINVEIPEGYKIANLDDINIKNVFNQDGKELMIFDSYYEINENILKITADEHYRKNIIPTEHYEAYRTVINSAADFNKLVLILEPK